MEHQSRQGTNPTQTQRRCLGCGLQCGTTVATASSDNTARLWNTKTGEELTRLKHKDAVWAVAFSADGTTVATASSDDTARLWNAKTSEELARLNHEDDVLAVAFSTDGTTVATAGSENTARFWYRWPQDLAAEICQRLTRNLTANEWLNYLRQPLHQYRQTCKNLPPHPSLVQRGIQFAQSGSLNQAIPIFRRAKELDPKIDLNPDTDVIDQDPVTTAKQLAAAAKAEEER